MRRISINNQRDLKLYVKKMQNHVNAIDSEWSNPQIEQKIIDIKRDRKSILKAKEKGDSKRVKELEKKIHKEEDCLIKELDSTVEMDLAELSSCTLFLKESFDTKPLWMTNIVIEDLNIAVREVNGLTTSLIKRDFDKFGYSLDATIGCVQDLLREIV